jgi:hypothetical protein
MIELQREQTTLLREGLLSAQQTATTALDRVAAPQEAKPGNASNFLRLRPASFVGVGTPLEAEKWLIDMTNLLAAARVSAADQVEMVKVLLIDMARSWWLARRIG